MEVTEENIRLIFGLKVRQLRQEKGLSFAALSKDTGLSASYLNEIEKGKKYPKTEKIAKLAESLGVSYDWLISLQLSKNLAPVSQLLKSNLLSDLPLEMFGLEPAVLLEMLSNAPAKLGAFLSTIIEISRNYGMQVENLYYNMLRSYQEMYDNYFEELEQSVKAFKKKYVQPDEEGLSYETLASILINDFNYSIDKESLGSQVELAKLRTIFMVGDKKRLLLNPLLNEAQQRFAVGQELAYAYLKLKPRPKTTTWIEVSSFEELLNNFKASYFSCALLLDEDLVKQDLEKWLKQDAFDADLLMSYLDKYQCSPEVLLHRMTNLLPRHFGIRELFFLRFTKNDDKFKLTKEMHLSGLHNPHGTALDEHYCRRWISIELLQKMNVVSDKKVICKSQRSKYADSDNEYLIITLAKVSENPSVPNSSVSIGMLINKNLKQKLKFWNDPNIPIRVVNETCETCSLRNCEERAAPPERYETKQKNIAMKAALKALTES
jgi:transcriptional regulator with XRE-family HTH domain